MWWVPDYPEQFLQNFQPGEILRVNEPDGTILRVHDNDIVDAVRLQDMQNLGSHVIGIDSNWLGGHELGDWSSAYFRAIWKMAGKVAVRENPGKCGVGGVDDDCRAGAGASHGEDCFGDWCFGVDAGEGFGWAHDIADAEEKAASEDSSGVELCEVFLSEAAGLEEHHC